MMNRWQAWFSRMTLFQWMLFVSFGAHAAVLGIRLGEALRHSRILKDTPLEVILVNAKGDAAPDQAQAYAQANLDGGGTLENGRSSSPLPSTSQAQAGDNLDDNKAIEEARQRQEKMLTTIKAQIASLSFADHPDQTDTQAKSEREEKRKLLMKLLGEIETRIQEENAKPKKGFISPATKEAIFATYYDHVRHKIEVQGTTYFPEKAGQKLYGELTMVITVNYTGRVLSTEVIEPSGIVALDMQSQAIVKSMEYGEFDPTLRKRADQLVIVTRFKYMRDQTLHTQLTAQ